MQGQILGRKKNCHEKRHNFFIRNTSTDPSLYLNQGFGSGSAWIRINLSCWIRIRIQIADPDPDPGGQK
jgi:hypothetical protein